MLYHYPGYCGTGLTELTEVPGTGMEVLQNFQKPGYGYESLAKLLELPGIVARAYRTPRSSGQVRNVLYPYPGSLWRRGTELPEVPGNGTSDLQKLQFFLVG